MTSPPLNEYTTIIRSGVTPTEPFRLSRERAEQLDADLRALRRARAQATVDAMTYPVVPR